LITLLSYLTSTLILIFSYTLGQVGDWKNWFTVAQSEMFDRVGTDKLKDVKIPLQYELKTNS